MARVTRSVLAIHPDTSERVIITPDEDAPKWAERVLVDDDDTLWSSDFPKPARRRAAASETPSTTPASTPGTAGGLFDPAAHTVPEVQAYLAGLAADEPGAAERQRVLDAEQAAGARKGVLEGA